MKEKLRQQLETAYNTVALHWKTPALGRYVPYKEILSYGVGGMGVQFVMFFAAQIALTATSFLVGNTIGIKPMHLQYMGIISTILGFGITIIRSYVIDSSRFKMGKFRPWLLTMGIPTVVIAVAFVWLPYETMTYVQKVMAVLICFNLMNCFSPFFQQSFTDLANVISPNSVERTDVISVSSVIYSFAPTLTGAFVPMLSKFTGGLNDIRTYRIIHPIIAIIGVSLSLIAVFGTKERIIVAKTHIQHFKFFDAFRSVAKNKYFWITSMAGWLGFLEGAVGVIIGWTFIYGYPDRMGTYGLLSTLIGNAALWSMLICPFAIRAIGKRNLLIWCNVANILFIGLLYPLYDNLIALGILYYLNGFVGAFAIVYNPGINADMRDYQQYYTGERIDGMFGAVGIIGSFIGMFTGLVLPFIYQTLGLQDNYDVLEVASFRGDMFQVLIVAATIGAALNTVPYFFYDLTETKQRGIAKVLKIRALFEDYGNGMLKDEDLVEAIDIIDEADRLYKDRDTITTKDDIKKTKHLPGNTAEEKEFKKAEIARVTANYKKFEADRKVKMAQRIQTAKSMPTSNDAEKAARSAAMKDARHQNRVDKRLDDELSVCDFVVDEMKKYDTLRIQKQLERSQKVAKLGAKGVLEFNASAAKAEAKALPATTHEEKIIKSDALANVRAIAGCQKNMKKYYPNGLVVPDAKAMELAEDLPEDNFTAKFTKKGKIKALVNEISQYNRSARVLLDAERMAKEKENYAHLDEIRAKYEVALERVNENNAKKKEELDKIEQERKADMERRKQERLAKKGKNK
ncbi:MAG: MFS transporter [Oscillospiraceae bacterium]